MFNVERAVLTDRFIRDSARCGTRSLSFAGQENFEDWKIALLAKLRELMGPMPEPADLRPQMLGSEDCGDFDRHKLVLQTEEDCWMPAYLLVPKSATERNPAPALLCCHGHGPHGKDSVAGVGAEYSDRRQTIEVYNYDYAAQMARRGYVTIAPDWRAFGERIGYERPFGSDPCNVQFLQEILRGRVLLTLNVFDAMRAVDYLAARPEVDADRIGCMGLSFGGTMTTFVTVLDERIRCADIICYVTPWQHFAYDKAQFCGSQIVPGLYEFADVPDVAGAIAPRPLLMEAGTQDTCFEYHAVKNGHEQVRRIYEAAGCADRLQIDVFEGGHAFNGALAFDFFDRYLKQGGA